jgi:cation diffusion facilitator family transporter
MEINHRMKAVRRITSIGVGINLFLGIIKIIFGLIGHSQALFADGIHSLSDLLTDGLVLVATHFGSKDADSDHPYGHGRFETLGTIILASILLLAGAGIVYDAIHDLLAHENNSPSSYVLLIAFISVLTNEVFFRITLRVAKKISSGLLEANAWHHRSDAASSIVVLIGVGGALLGYAYWDTAAACIVGLMIAKMAISLAWSGLRELVDTGVDESMQAQIQTVINQVKGVRALHQLRTRSMAGAIFVDAHVLVDPHLTVSEGHHIGSWVHHHLMKEIPAIRDVIVHIDHEDDENIETFLHLPSSEELLPTLKQLWQNLPGSHRIESIRFHYLSGYIHLDIYLPI